ncbi:MAG: Alanine-tRNA ligase [candidate division WS6 bacterium GW2011_GWC1_36_11]|uniref:alanine--tRNA ligase n=3 Tax=Candidatus Dojkabacteria TaxID=74243 RepID=A0A0G0DFR3_9BACT|nr:MAG: Alanine-tRNA ligase [candidate division WS6 bacterium GW2011_GWC1_36_11]KKQ03893.1 MAG: Alanine-tRNA ligase [candidate division WS6 bacterium GW2011_WS6_36_26]KKQ11523.1 MAG: Alanine-tRNA ligase [candidate division WS6 bacterium GW2011_GWC2_36_7]KKQ17822.1 MAG: Alanine-tRNA ligase [candidate division WS6 bacterium GW2011_GWF1_36_8]HAM37213.1 alanine--tRNA ligase [Patescibacteria group bacterium]
MNTFSYKEIRDKYIEYFKKNNHQEIPSAPLVPENDPSVLFVNAGMFPLVPFLQGETHPKGTRLVNSQRCVRTGDIDEVGDASHCTTFEMLGNWSLNDYFKREAITMTVRFFVEELGFDINKIYATVFKGDETAPKDTDSIEAWKDIFKEYDIDAEVGDRIIENGKEDNWWGLATGGPCGPDSEIFYEVNGKKLEIGNNVFMEYLKTGDEYNPLGRHNVDFGGGLDRITCVSQGVDNFYETDIYKPIFDLVKSLGKNDILVSQRIITDHIKAATWMIMDGVEPSRNEQGYILRRIIRRAIRHGRKLGIEGLFTRRVGDIAIQQFSPIYSQLEADRERILNILEEEEQKFSRTLENGLKESDRIIKDGEDLPVKAFKLYETYGFPIELTIEELQNRKIEFNEENLLNGFQEEQKKHQELSRTSSAGMFKGGLADTSDMSTKYHTTTHLLLATLRKILGDQVYQKGSNITPERLRFDYPSDSKLTPEQAKQVEEIINEQIQKALPITYEELPKEEALKMVPFAAFSEKYGDIVKVYTIGDKTNPYSVEICNGPHVSNTKELGTFRIAKQENVAAGIKRIKAVLE